MWWGPQFIRAEMNVEGSKTLSWGGGKNIELTIRKETFKSIGNGSQIFKNLPYEGSKTFHFLMHVGHTDVFCWFTFSLTKYMTKHLAVYDNYYISRHYCNTLINSCLSPTIINTI